MKTLRINPFNLRPQIKNMFRKPKHVEIPATLPKELGNKLLAMQGSLDYMATNYGINFVIHDDNAANAVHLTCLTNDCEANSHQITEADDDETVARKIYEAASNVLLGYKKYN
jgi:hypothetical protein